VTRHAEQFTSGLAAVPGEWQEAHASISLAVLLWHRTQGRDTEFGYSTVDERDQAGYEDNASRIEPSQGIESGAPALTGTGSMSELCEFAHLLSSLTRAGLPLSLSLAPFC